MSKEFDELYARVSQVRNTWPTLARRFADVLEGELIAMAKHHTVPLEPRVLVSRCERLETENERLQNSNTKLISELSACDNHLRQVLSQIRLVALGGKVASDD